MLTVLLSENNSVTDFTRLKLVQGKKEEQQLVEAEMKKKAVAEGLFAQGKENDADITAAFDATDDAEVVF